MRCPRCQGSGTLMGQGMIFVDCDCDSGELFEDNALIGDEPKALPVCNAIDRRSKAYKEAISDLMKSGCSKEEAVKMFDAEYERL